MSEIQITIMLILLTVFVAVVGWYVYCCGLIESDTLIRDNNNQLLRCQNGTETNIQTIF